jgi:hypothetical protein
MSAVADTALRVEIVHEQDSAGIEENRVNGDRSIFLVLGLVAVALVALVIAGNSFGNGTPIY